MGNKLVLTGTTITDATAPMLLSVDLLETVGSLALYEPGHPAGPLVGVPATGAVISNLLANKAMATIPGSTAGTLAATFRLTADFSGTQGKVERSTLGGLHMICSQATPGAATRIAGVYGQAAIRDYLIAHPTHDAYISIWGRYTRVQKAGSNTTRSYMLATTGDWYRFYSRPIAGQATYPLNATIAGYHQTPNVAPNALGPFFQNSWKHPTYAPNGTILPNLFSFGNSTNLPGYDASGIMYRYYMEDLTVSGRSYAQVDALDFAEYTKQVLTAGGRYYGDTFTDPATIP